MKKFITGEDRHQLALFPERLDDSIAELDLLELGFDKVEPADTGRPSYHPSTLLKNLHLRLLESHSIFTTAGAGNAAQLGIDLVNRSPKS